MMGLDLFYSDKWDNNNWICIVGAPRHAGTVALYLWSRTYLDKDLLNELRHHISKNHQDTLHPNDEKLLTFLDAWIDQHGPKHFIYI